MSPQIKKTRAISGTRGSQSTYYGQKPLWVVPKARKLTQPNQKGGGTKSQSQAGFYKSTRGSDPISGECNLAIDARNSVNLQEAIDKYYKGELTKQDELCNGDPH